MCYDPPFEYLIKTIHRYLIIVDYTPVGKQNFSIAALLHSAVKLCDSIVQQ